jgi:uncharacterized membrane protein
MGSTCAAGQRLQFNDGSYRGLCVEGSGRYSSFEGPESFDATRGDSQAVSGLYVDIFAYVFSFSLIGSYYVFLRARLNKDRTYTIQSVNRDARAAWVDNIMSDKGKGILGVQTLRNSTMAATFLASTAILLMMGVLNLIRSGGDKNMLEALQAGIIGGGNMEDIKLLLLLVSLFTAFFCFTMAVRIYNHVGFLINSTSAKLAFCPTSAYVSRLLNRGGCFFSYGMRAYYVSVPLVFGLFSPYYLIIASIVMVFSLYHIDRAPEVQASELDIRKHTPASRFHFVPTSSDRKSDITGMYHAAEDKTSGGDDVNKKAG